MGFRITSMHTIKPTIKDAKLFPLPNPHRAVNVCSVRGTELQGLPYVSCGMTWGDSTSLGVDICTRVKGNKITMKALEAGAVDFIAKPIRNFPTGLNTMLTELRSKVKIAAIANLSCCGGEKPHPPAGRAATTPSTLAEPDDKIIAIGASTGGTEAIRKVIEKFPVTTPGTVIVQHMPVGFTRMFSERLNQLCQMEVKEAEHGDRLRCGLILIAPGGKQLEVVRSDGHYEVRLGSTEKVSGHSPSVDVMMHSVAKHVGANAVAAMLTGMGQDGAEGMLAMKQAGARCISQDEASSVIFGMPKVAYEKGGAERLVPLDNIATSLLNLLT
ncbi:MAG: chemotaxis response regulator protein-glutamate methylesterase [Desulfuromusa sp.]|nr:chemotaxis response regulator protein-glutamate methylesterase [Desulfuromusa sp.]